MKRMSMALAGLACAAATMAGASPAVAGITGDTGRNVVSAPPGYVWTGHKFWTLAGCTAKGNDLIASGRWNGPPFCDGSGVFWDLYLIPR